MADMQQMRYTLEQVASNCSLRVGMQKCIFKQNGQRQIKEKVFDLIFETDRDVIQNVKRKLNEKEIPS